MSNWKDCFSVHSSRLRNVPLGYYFEGKIVSVNCLFRSNLNRRLKIVCNFELVRFGQLHILSRVFEFSINSLTKFQ